MTSLPATSSPDVERYFRTRPLDPIGVEVVGFDLRSPISDAAWAALRQGVIDTGLVVFRDQSIDAATQLALGRRFGTLENTSLDQGPLDESRILLSNLDEDGRVRAEDDDAMRLVAINESWHTDSSFRDVPASFSLFSAVTVPAAGGDTFYASLERGWQALPAAERAPLFGRYAVHDYDRAYRARGLEMEHVFGGAAPTARHPVVHRHPESGRTGLFVSEHAFAVDGLGEAESRQLVERLVGICTDPERVYRHRWRAGDLVIWDNRSMLHRAQGFDSRHPRVMRHVRVAGDGPAIAATA